MSNELIGVAGLLILFILLAARAPIGLAMLVVGVGGNAVLAAINAHFRFFPYLKQFKTLLWTTVSHYELSVLPLFILMGCISANIGISRDLFTAAAALVGRLRGGTPMAAVCACAGFGAVCGSSLATASTMGKIALPELRRARYAPGFAAGVLAAGGTLGILIPPSVVLVIYAIIVEASVIQMFQAALLPGILAVLFFLLVIAALTRFFPRFVGTPQLAAVPNRRQALLQTAPVLLIFAGLILGLGAGLFTPTPAAAVGVFAVTVYGIANKRLTRDGLHRALLSAATMTAMITFILFGAEVLKGFFSRAGLPAALAAWAQLADLPPFTLLILVLLAFIILGCFMDSLSMVLVVVPFFWPVLVDINGGDTVTADGAAFGMNAEQLKVWFGILCLIVVELGLITPPVGLNVYVIAAVAKDIPMNAIFQGVLPFVAAELLRVGVILLFPVLALWLPFAMTGGAPP